MMEPIVFIPGMMCDSRLFEPQIAAFSGFHTLHLAPLVGHNTIEELATTILAHAPENFALAGLSMGGIVAMEIITQAPARITRLALLDTNPMVELAEVKKRREVLIARVMAGELEQLMLEEIIPRYLPEGIQNPEVVSLCVNMAMSLGQKVFVQQSRALRSRQDYQEALKEIRVPTLVLCGEDDQVCPPEKHRHMQSLITGARLEMIKDAGHLPTLEQPEKVNDVLSRWLSW